ncbi:MAG: hypothetical protein COB37_07475 [Kordiimonadales bacterium]|nr:MAG: hypothetical protein COB37_07475 [Kordiimonadales bacterium]
MLKRYLEFAGQTKVLITSFVLMVLCIVAFTNMPNLEELAIDVRKEPYDLAFIMGYMMSLGAEGRAAYLSANLVDMAFPIFYGSLFAGLLFRFRAADALWFLALVPILLMAVDYGENFQIRAMLNGFPDISEMQVANASMFTSVKQILSSASTFLVSITLIVALVRKLLSLRNA